jgi:hypothetical protein
MFKKVIFSLLLIVVSSCGTLFQTQQKAFLKIENKVITLDQSSNIYSGLSEPSIVINKKDPENIVGGSIYDNVYVSFDNGKNWQKDHLSSPFGVFGDPCLASDERGNLYYLHLSNPLHKTDSTYLIDRIVIQHSVDKGQSWTPGTGIGYNPPKQQDKQWIGIEPKTGSLAVTWTEFDKYASRNPQDHSRILFSQSSDNGKTWTEPIKINELDGDCLDDDYTTEGAVPVWDKNGNVYVAWAYGEKIFFDKSADRGKTWLDKDIVAATQPGGWNYKVPGVFRANGLPVLGIDNSQSKYSGTLYINWTDQRNGKDNTDVFLIKSTDQGNTWSEPMRINTDKTRTHQYLSWMSIDPVTGNIYIVYYDRSRFSDNSTEVKLAMSKNGGKSFVTKTISDSPFIPVQNAFMGDYNNIDAYNGKVVPIWTELTKNHIGIKATVIKVE